MKKSAVIALVCVLALSACIPNLGAQPNLAPTANLAATTNSIVQTANALTLAAQPSPTTVPASDTPLPPLPPATDIVIPNTDTPIPNLATTPATATSVPAENPTSTFTAAPIIGSPTASATLGVLTYGTLPPANRPYTGITIINKSKAEAYISLQVVTDQGYTIIEYPVRHTVKVNVPTGDYTYVVWVGGRKFGGYFHLGKNSDLTIVIFKDKVEVNKGP
jgi:hypothetical protein